MIGALRDVGYILAFGYHRADRLLTLTEEFDEFVRRALAERAERTLSGQVPTAEQLVGFIGIVHGGGGQARRTGDAFSDMIAERHGRG